MFNIFETQKEPMTPEAKVRFILKKCLHPGLQNAVETMRSRMALSPGKVTVTVVSNYLLARVSELPDYLAKNRNISALDNDTSAPSQGVEAHDGTIFTGYYSNWNKLTKEDRNKVFEERKRLGLNNRNRNKEEGDGSLDKSSDYKKLQNIIKQGKRKIAALKKKMKFEEGDDENDSDEAKDGENDDAGNQFGGKRTKKKQN